MELQPYYKLCLELSVKDNLVFRGSRLIAPIALQSVLISLVHEGHQGEVRTKQRLRDLYWWPGIDAQVHDAVRRCPICPLNDKTAKSHPAPLQPVPLPDGPWQKVAVDIVMPFDCRFAITLVDIANGLRSPLLTLFPQMCFRSCHQF